MVQCNICYTKLFHSFYVCHSYLSSLTQKEKENFFSCLLKMADNRAAEYSSDNRFLHTTYIMIVYACVLAHIKTTYTNPYVTEVQRHT